jgi:hypothetical protein
MKKILLSICIGFIVPLAASAAESMTSADVDSMVNQMKSSIDQYATRIKYLEQENAILRNEVMKAGIKIPLSVYSGTGIITSTGTSMNISTAPILAGTNT